MARSTYIYVVEGFEMAASPLATFTVKHEMQRWLLGADPYRIVWRYSDGDHSEPKEMTEEEIWKS